MENVKVQPEYPRGLDFEQVWAALMENREQQKETDRQMNLPEASLGVSIVLT